MPRPGSARKNCKSTSNGSKKPSAATTACWVSNSTCLPPIRTWSAQGLVLWLPKGATIRGLLESFIREELIKRGYQAVYTPHIGRIELYQISGHFPYYSDSQFKPIVMSDDERYLLKPMNCPHHVMIYKSKPRSYRDLPVRLAEFGTVYRYEQSGELGGMTRVRGFTQDDAHLFCTEEQVGDEFRGCIEMTQSVLAALGMDEYRVRLGFRDPASDKYIGSDDVWERAEQTLEQVCREMNLPHLDVERGEAAFYGPKADFVVSDCLGASGSSAPCSSITTCPAPSVSTWNTSAPITSRTSR